MTISNFTHFLATVVLVSQLSAQPKSLPPQPAPPREAVVSAIPGVVAAGAQWKAAWKGNETADGITGSEDGGLLFAQAQTSRVYKLDKNDKASVLLSNGHGVAAVAIDPQKRIIVAERPCADLSQKPDQCTEPMGIAVLTPTRQILTNQFEGKPQSGLNDLVIDKKGGVYFTFTNEGAFYLDTKGKVSRIASNLRTNGIVLSPDGKTLYITNGLGIAAFDVQSDGSVRNQRDFGKLEGEGSADGLAVDAVGRLYVCTRPGIQVLSPDGKHMGLIPTPRNATSVAFGGPGKKMLYVSSPGATGPDGMEIRTPEGVRNWATSVYKITMLAQGYKGRPK